MFQKQRFFIFSGLFFCSIAFSQHSLFSLSDDYIVKKYSQRWELDSIDKHGTFRLMSYKPIYLAPARWSSKPNDQPYSENPDYSVDEAKPYNSIETKFQLSFKTKVIQGLFNNEGDIWLGYTQKAHWQVFNVKLSRVFRELNYEPELIFMYPVSFSFLGGKFRTIGLALNHQSNGKDLPTSRSWNRIIFNLGYENGNWLVSFHPWIRLKDDEDENPSITKYIGNGELNAAYTYNRHQFYAIVTHPFNHLKYGSMQLNYVFPLKGHLRGHVQFFDGYGETMIDYNHHQTTVGIGISFSDW
ncbi:phospholipase A [Flavobacterium sp. NRK F10]|uniref:phospholipase A n=1 Tax=Flavobacterium sp. NRK F10 TaxID=2954931 RepID=UPI0020908252|nr:phospholipase A [Flavobacterium sp. NRK F10]MCO6175617.1 phospholipase A [Flavobacterium sp. NRK F10]